MTTRNQWSQGLQWGACTWLPYVAWLACRDASFTSIAGVVELWPQSWRFAVSWFLAPAWLAVILLIAAGSRWSRVAVAAMILVRAGLYFPQGVGEQGALYGDGPVPYALAHLPVLLPLLPLVVLRVEHPRVVVALAALGRWREAFARVGGVGPVLVAMALLSTYSEAHEYLARGADGRGFVIPIGLAVVAAVATMRSAQQRRPVATGC